MANRPAADPDANSSSDDDRSVCENSFVEMGEEERSIAFDEPKQNQPNQRDRRCGRCRHRAMRHQVRPRRGRSPEPRAAAAGGGDAGRGHLTGLAKSIAQTSEAMGVTDKVRTSYRFPWQTRPAPIDLDRLAQFVNTLHKGFYVSAKITTADLPVTTTRKAMLETWERMDTLAQVVDIVVARLMQVLHMDGRATVPRSELFANGEGNLTREEVLSELKCTGPV